jgi:hypothetical protein
MNRISTSTLKRLGSEIKRCSVPSSAGGSRRFNIRFVEEQPVVTGYASPDAGMAGNIKLGDVIAELDGIPVATLVGR